MHEEEYEPEFDDNGTHEQEQKENDFMENLESKLKEEIDLMEEALQDMEDDIEYRTTLIKELLLDKTDISEHRAEYQKAYISKRKKVKDIMQKTLAEMTQKYSTLELTH